MQTQIASERFFGAFQARRQLDALSIAELTPTVPADELDTHTHDDAHFVLLVDGVYVSSAQGMPPRCVGPALVVNPPGTKHRDHFAQTHGRFVTLSLSATAWEREARYRALPTRALRLGGTALTHAVTLWRHLHAWDDAAQLGADAAWPALLDHAADDTLLYSPRCDVRLARIRDRLREQCTLAPRLAELAREVDWHPVHLARTFRRQFGCSPGEFLRHCRLQRALECLHDARRPLAEIACASGFADQAHFTHAFRRAYGITPAAYRAGLPGPPSRPKPVRPPRLQTYKPDTDTRC